MEVSAVILQQRREAQRLSLAKLEKAEARQGEESAKLAARDEAQLQARKLASLESTRKREAHGLERERADEERTAAMDAQAERAERAEHARAALHADKHQLFELAAGLRRRADRAKREAAPEAERAMQLRALGDKKNAIKLEKRIELLNALAPALEGRAAAVDTQLERVKRVVAAADEAEEARTGARAEGTAATAEPPLDETAWFVDARRLQTEPLPTPPFAPADAPASAIGNIASAADLLNDGTGPEGSAADIIVQGLVKGSADAPSTPA